MAPTRVKIPLSKGLYLNSDPLETSDFASALMNCFITKAGAMTKRPGLTTAVNLGTNRPVEGLYWFNEAGYALAVSDGKVFKITKSGGLYSSTQLTGSTLRNYSATGGTGRVTFTDDGVNVYMANGGAINYHVAASLTAQPLSDADAPTTVSHVAYMNNRVIANIDGTSRFQWSDIGNGLSWTATAWATAEGDADWILSLAVGHKEIVLFGEQTIEVWYDDGQTPFAPIPGAFIQRGTTSQDSVQFINGDWLFLDDNNNVCRMRERSVEIISTPIEKELKALSNLSDALSGRIDIAGETFYTLSFPTANRTFVWKVGDDRFDGWSEWGDNAGGRVPWQCHSHCYGWSANLVGSKSTGLISVLSADSVDDHGSTAIPAYRVTGWIDHGTMSYKNCLGLTFKVKDAANATVTSPTLSFRYRNDGSGTWSDYRTISMTGGNVQRALQLGRYRTRQWEFRNEQQCLMDIVDISEDVEVMSS